jgi:hypothetical protein
MKLWSVVILAGVCASAASAQSGEFSISFGDTLMKDNILGIAANLQGTEYKADGGFTFGLRFTLNTKKYLGHEFGFAYNRTQLGAVGIAGSDSSMPTYQGLYDVLLYATPEGSAKIRPYVAGGGQFTTFVPPGASVYSGTTKFGGNFGAGVKVKITSMFLLRFDVRDYVSGKPFGNTLIDQSGVLHQIEATAGLGLYF